MNLGWYRDQLVPMGMSFYFKEEIMKIYDELVWRGLIKDVSSPEIEEKLNNGGLTFYIGTDPTGDSLHIGHFFIIFN